MAKKKIDTLKADEQPTADVTVDDEKDKGGRPAIEITDDIIAQAETLAAQGMGTEQIALALGMGASTFYEKQKRYPELKEAVKAGKAKGIAIVTEKLLEKAMNLDTTAMIFYLKCQAGWRDTQAVQLTGADGAPLLPALTVQFVDASDDDDDKE